MANYIVKLDNLSDKEFRQKREDLVCELFQKEIEDAPETARTIIFERMAAKLNLASASIRHMLSRRGMETALPAYKNCGKR